MGLSGGDPANQVRVAGRGVEDFYIINLSVFVQ